MPDVTRSDSLEQAIVDSFRSETLRILDEEIEEAKKRVETRLREHAGAIATKVAGWVDFRRNEQQIVISVDIKKSE